MGELTDARFWNESKKGLSAASSMMPLMPETKTIPSGPLDLRRGPKLTDPVALKALRERLQGHASSIAWLPSDGPLGEAVADLRKMHVERCIRAHRALADAHAIEDEFTEEDRRHVEALRVAVAAGKDTPADERTAEADRDARRQAARERLEAEILALADEVDRVVSELRAREDTIIDALTRELAPAAAKRVEAERLLREAERQEWTLFASARWLHTATDSRALGKQPFAATADPPPTWTGGQVRRGLNRHWTEIRSWNRDADDDESSEAA